ncbi:MAG: DNA polymerase III subunit gamma/tau [Oligoflexales bacterium]
MSYQTIAIKYRPNCFSDLVGQDIAVRALQNSVKLGRYAHGVIFSGVRGIGKTTSARIYAKALNCTLAQEGEPCGSCDSCVAIARGVHEDVQEVDGASNNGVDEVRSLLESVYYKPQRSRFRVYIIDEVHMLSVNAFNALLKTLEEPPAHAIFILATTELHKVPKTVIGRCQTFHLKKMSQHDAVARIRWILDQENIPYEDSALGLIAREGEGSMRDALTLLEQVIALGEGQVKTQVVTEFTSGVSTGVCFELLRSLVRRDAQRIFAGIEYLDQRGARFKEVLSRLMQWVRHSFVAKHLGKESAELVNLGLREDDQAKLMVFISHVETRDFHQIFRMLMACLQEMDGSSLDRFVLENNIFEWCSEPSMQSGGGEGGVSSSQAKPLGLLRAELSQKSNPEKKNFENLTKNFQPSREPASEVPSVSFSEAEVPPVSFSEAEVPSVSFSTPVGRVLSESSQQRLRHADGEKSSDLDTPNLESSHFNPDFPATWFDFFRAWQKKRRFRAAKFSEAVPLEFSSQKIVLGVVPGDIALRETEGEGTAKLLADWNELFGFQGVFQVLASEKYRHAKNTVGALLSVQKDEKKQQIEKELLEGDVAQVVLDVLGGEKGEVRFTHR